MGLEILLYAECHHIILALLSLFIGIKLYTFTLFSTNSTSKLAAWKQLQGMQWRRNYTLLQMYVSLLSQLVGPTTSLLSHLVGLTASGTHQLWVSPACEKEKVYTRNRVYFLAMKDLLLLVQHFVNSWVLIFLARWNTAYRSNYLLLKIILNLSRILYFNWYLSIFQIESLMVSL